MRQVVLCLACILVMPLLAIVMLGQATVGSKDRAQRMAIALDQCGNAALGGSEDETISSRAGRAKRDGKKWGYVAVWLIDGVFGKGHCAAEIGT